MAIVASLMGAWLTRRLGIKRIFLLSLCADLLTPFALLVGVTTVAMFAMHVCRLRSDDRAAVDLRRDRHVPQLAHLHHQPAV